MEGCGSWQHPYPQEDEEQEQQEHQQQQHWCNRCKQGQGDRKGVCVDGRREEECKSDVEVRVLLL